MSKLSIHELCLNLIEQAINKVLAVQQENPWHLMAALSILRLTAEGEIECRALPWLAFGPDPPPVPCNNTGDDRKADA